MTILRVQGKVSDTGTYTVIDDDGTLLNEFDGYVPTGLGVGGSDYIDISINIETGMVIGWNAEAIKARLQQMQEDRE